MGSWEEGTLDPGDDEAAGALPGGKPDPEPMPPSGGGGDTGYTLLRSLRLRAEAYFAIGELTWEETQGLRSEPLGKTLGETLDRLRGQRKDNLAAPRRLDIPGVDETERLALTESLA